MESVFDSNYGSHVGRVKWFKPKLGYGFITVKLDDSEKDVFVHQSNIKMKYCTFRTLRRGEYVALDLKKTDNTQDGQAVNVSGVFGGPLYCDFIPSETRDHHNSEEVDEHHGYT